MSPIQQMLLGSGGAPAELLVGQYQVQIEGTYNWTVPANVEAVSVACIGGGGAGASASPWMGGGGGAVSYKNNIAVTAGSSITVVVGVRGENAYKSGGVVDGGDSYFSSTSVCKAEGGHSYDNGQNQSGGNASNCVGDGSYSGGNGSGHYGGQGGKGSVSDGGAGTQYWGNPSAGGAAGSGGGGGGADGGTALQSYAGGTKGNTGAYIGGGGGGGSGGYGYAAGGGGGGSYGSTSNGNGQASTNYKVTWVTPHILYAYPGSGGYPGGGGGGYGPNTDFTAISGYVHWYGRGAYGGVRILYPAVYADGSVRSFPATNIGDL